VRAGKGGGAVCGRCAWVLGEEGVRGATVTVRCAAAVLDALRRAEEAERALEQERRAALEELRVTWGAQRDPRLGVAWPMSNPARVREEKPPRGGLWGEEDSPVRHHPSSAQVFAGEALEDARIPAAKRAALLRGLDAQVADKARGQVRAREARAAEEDALSAALARAAELERETDKERARLQRELLLENAALARASKVRTLGARAAESSLSAAETDATLADPRLLEDRALQYRAGDPARTRKDHFKGFSQEEVDLVRLAQLQQQRENEARRIADRERAEREAAAERAALRAADDLERESERARAASLRDWTLDVAAQKRAQRVRRDAESRFRRERFDETAAGILDGFGKSLK
jgi:hypothetical protein